MDRQLKLIDSQPISTGEPTQSVFNARCDFFCAAGLLPSLNACPSLGL